MTEQNQTGMNKILSLKALLLKVGKNTVIQICVFTCKHGAFIYQIHLMS